MPYNKAKTRHALSKENKYTRIFLFIIKAHIRILDSINIISLEIKNNNNQLSLLDDSCKNRKSS